jgi:hypothetical protein
MYICPIKSIDVGFCPTKIFKLCPTKSKSNRTNVLSSQIFICSPDKGATCVKSMLPHIWPTWVELWFSVVVLKSYFGISTLVWYCSERTKCFSFIILHADFLIILLSTIFIYNTHQIVQYFMQCMATWKWMWHCDSMSLHACKQNHATLIKYFTLEAKYIYIYI